MKQSTSHISNHFWVKCGTYINEVLLGFKREGNTVPQYNMNEPWDLTLSEINKPFTKSFILDDSSSYELPGVVRSYRKQNGGYQGAMDKEKGGVVI